MEKERLKGFLWGIVACVVITLLAGCRSVRYVPVGTVRTDSVFVNRWNKDSVFVHDSVFVSFRTGGDTVYAEKVTVKYLYRDRVRYDTVSIIRADSVQVPYPVEKKLGWWEETRINMFPVLLIAVAVLAFIVVRILRKTRKK